MKLLVHESRGRSGLGMVDNGCRSAICERRWRFQYFYEIISRSNEVIGALWYNSCTYPEDAESGDAEMDN